MTEQEPTIYERMARERMRVASAQIAVLNFYDPQNEELRMEALYNATHRAAVTEQTEQNLAKIDEIIFSFSREIKQYRATHPDLEKQNPQLRERLSVMESLLSSE